VVAWTRKFFGPRHAFVVRIAGIIGNLYKQKSEAEKSVPFLQEAKDILAELGQ
jgi:hypothetical protein